MDEMFSSGGPHNIRRTGHNEYSMSISIPKDTDGMIARECPSSICSPAYFKVRPGTGVADGQTEAFCPYCHHSDDPNSFTTKAQIEYARQVAMREATDGVDRAIKKALDLGPSGQRIFGGGLVSFMISYKPGQKPHIWRPFEEALRRDIICPKCRLDHAVFGLAIWCPDCGADIFLVHAAKEYQVVRLILSDVDSRRDRLGARVATRDIENALEDTVSIFEAVLRAATRRYLRENPPAEETEGTLMKRIGNKYQNIRLAGETVRKVFGASLFSALNDDEYRTLEQIFEKRHPITHNLGIVDRKYLERVSSGELEGRDVHVSVDEVSQAIELCIRVLYDFYPKVFPGATVPQ